MNIFRKKVVMGGDSFTSGCIDKKWGGGRRRRARRRML